jgi:RNA polymerase sigma-70 factor (ECF subfamily)
MTAVSPRSPTPDGALVRRLRGGDDDAATQLYRRYAGRLRRVAAAQTDPALSNRLDPEDLVQSIFRTFFRRVAAGEYDVPDGDELWKLLLVIGLNKLRGVANFHKAAKRDVRRTTGEEAMAAVPVAADDEDLRVLELTIDDLLAPLPPTHREIIALRIAGHEVADVAAKAGRSRRSVERILHEFRARLGSVLNDAR